jgi:hypothetical protein
MKCQQQNCNEDATHKVYWPGKPEPLLMCARHKRVSEYLADAMGMNLCVEPIASFDEAPDAGSTDLP